MRRAARSSAERAKRFLTLRRTNPRPPWVSLLWRALLAIALVGITLLVHWLDRYGLHDTIDGIISFADVLYFTMVTVTTVGYGDIVPVTPRARLFDALVVTPIRLFIWLIFLGTAYEFVFKNVWENWRMSVIQKHLRDHIVVAGFGSTGSEAVRELIRRGTKPQSIVVIDSREAALEAAERTGVTVLDADASRNATLEAVQLERASGMIVAAGADDTSILIVLTARRVAHNVPVSVVIRNEDNEPLARQAGASTVINPANFAGLLLAGSTQGKHLTEYLADLAAIDGRVAMRERPATAEDIGRKLPEITTGLGLRIYKGDSCYGFWEDAVIEEGDSIVEIVPRSGKEGGPRKA